MRALACCIGPPFPPPPPLAPDPATPEPMLMCGPPPTEDDWASSISINATCSPSNISSTMGESCVSLPPPPGEVWWLDTDMAGAGCTTRERGKGINQFMENAGWASGVTEEEEMPAVRGCDYGDAKDEGRLVCCSPGFRSCDVHVTRVWVGQWGDRPGWLLPLPSLVLSTVLLFLLFRCECESDHHAANKQ